MRTAVRPPSDLSERRQFIRTSHEAPIPLALWGLSGRVNTSSGQTAQGAPTVHTTVSPESPASLERQLPSRKGADPAMGLEVSQGAIGVPPAGHRTGLQGHVAQGTAWPRSRRSEWVEAAEVSVGGWALARSGASPPFWDPLSGSQDQVPLCATHSPEQRVTPGGGSGRRGPRGLCPREHAVPRAPTWDFEPAPLSRKSCRLLPRHSVPSQAPSSM